MTICPQPPRSPWGGAEFCGFKPPVQLDREDMTQLENTLLPHPRRDAHRKAFVLHGLSSIGKTKLYEREVLEHWLQRRSVIDHMDRHCAIFECNPFLYPNHSPVFLSHVMPLRYIFSDSFAVTLIGEGTEWMDRMPIVEAVSTACLSHCPSASDCCQALSG